MYLFIKLLLLKCLNSFSFLYLLFLLFYFKTKYFIYLILLFNILSYIIF